MQKPRMGRRAPSQPSAEPVAAVIARRVSRRVWGRRIEATIEPPGPDVGWEHRLETAEVRIEHLETALEGLQDALYRHEVLVGKDVGELQRQTEPGQMARTISQDARRRGL